LVLLPDTHHKPMLLRVYEMHIVFVTKPEGKM